MCAESKPAAAKAACASSMGESTAGTVDGVPGEGLAAGRTRWPGHPVRAGGGLRYRKDSPAQAVGSEAQAVGRVAMVEDTVAKPSGAARNSGLGSARLGSARLGSARLGSARLGSARLIIPSMSLVTVTNRTNCSLTPPYTNTQDGFNPQSCLSCLSCPTVMEWSGRRRAGPPRRPKIGARRAGGLRATSGSPAGRSPQQKRRKV